MVTVTLTAHGCLNDHLGAEKRSQGGKSRWSGLEYINQKGFPRNIAELTMMNRVNQT